MLQSMQTVTANEENHREEALVEEHYEKWTHWPVNWSAVWVGALASLAAVLLLGLVGIAIGAHLVGPEHRVVDLKAIGLGTLAYSIFSAFLAFVIGGWVAVRVAGVLRSEPAMLYGAIVWLLALPILVVLAGVGAGSYLGGWYGGVAGTPSWGAPASAPFDRPEPPGTNATEQERARLQGGAARVSRQGETMAGRRPESGPQRRWAR